LPSQTTADNAIRVRGRSQRILAIALLISVVAHVSLLALLPGNAEAPTSVTPQVLDVVLVEPEKPPQSAAAAVPSPEHAANTQKQPPREVRSASKEQKRKRSQSTQPALPATPPEPTRTVPAEPPAANAAQPAEPAASPPAPRTTPPLALVAPTPLTPPSFNAAYLRNPAPRYPPIARRNGEQGTVTLRVLVSRDGLPARVSIEKTSGSRHLDAAALETVQSWRFAPARSGTEPVEAWVLVPIVFRLEGAS
jgi:periplasmic protein TonB